MKNETLQNILSQFPDDCEILILSNDYASPDCVSVEYEEDNNFDLPKIIIEV
jgi:hypothetical protein